MSSFPDTAIHPVTGKPTPCMRWDNYFGRYCYGVQFDGETHVYREAEVKPVPPAPDPET